MAAHLLGTDFANMLSSRKQFVDTNDENKSGAVEGKGDAYGKGLGTLSHDSYGTFTAKSATGFCGLANQGATCYLNSLIQAMYMLPAFRAAVFSWEHDPDLGEESRDVTRQLQRLFAELALSERCCATTTALTTSFGWSGGQQFQQQDVQECSAVILDYLARSAAGTPLGEHMARCHAGSTNRVLRCLGCQAVRPPTASTAGPPHWPPVRRRANENCTGLAQIVGQL
jgi:hypothetical protein